MRTMILEKAESVEALKDFFAEQNINPYDYILVKEMTDDLDFQNELLKCLKEIRKFVNRKGFEEISNLFSFRFTNGFWFTINLEEDNYIYNCRFDIGKNFNDKNFIENKEILEMYIGTSLFGNEF